ncbi:DUF2332 domain-containing protein [Lysinibacillus sp. 54212]|uniref:DUF2332 domain-containing protein n=1 Tax=Lysinibacillus sp. 54212 TaxID=3119829 RepID=UPI002FCB5E98
MDHYQKSFIRFAEAEAQNSSPLYFFLSKKIVEDEELMGIVREIPITQPKPNLFFGAMHYLVCKSTDPITAYYPSCTENPYPVEDSFPAFKAFALEHKQQLLALFQTRLVQTNEVNRCSFLYPLFFEIAKKRNRSLTLIEIGTSAGLLLTPDLYNYRIKNGEETILIEREKNAPSLCSVNKGEPLPVMEGEFLMDRRIGIDLNVIDLEKSDDVEWMIALIWPEHHVRRERFKKAATVATTTEKELYQGDLLEILPNVFSTLSRNTEIIVFHTHVANQFSEKLKVQFEQLLLELSKDQPFYHIYNNMYDENLHQDFLGNGISIQEKNMPRGDGHGNVFYWMN